MTEESILDTFKEVLPNSPDEPVKFEEKPIDPIIEQSILDSIKEASNITFEAAAKTEEPKKPIAEQTVLPSNKETMPTFFEEIVDDEIPEVRIDPIEKSILISIKEAAKVVFEEPKITKEPKVTEVPEIVKIAEENLEIGKPLDFSTNEKHSFQEWLQLARTEPIDRTEEGPQKAKEVEKTVKPKIEAEIVDDEKKKKAEIIDKFIETNPKISPIKQTAIVPAVQFDLNTGDNSYLMTETLARVYLEQKKYTKAIQAYEILILKYPEKISFFADRISDIKILQQNNNNN
ncbi:tetratricopeptide repeat protein [Flavobacterium sp. NPDC079362]|uniref:tetratricopeptide repeat protein n=1 Tax=Flavobacterium sp. NPDC079362 TaxID=3390566 RepID=UPI003D08BE0F